ncbi:MAG: prepilin-type N-terminal cleavage/methylation domain-containing protein [Armatimonadetes bacterium]|nr:prepilin-type N-terminal cleavage/methylation domain-containing protein [Armatimonadota bacterium]
MKKAFTLIELLVVIAIIAILAAILFPVFTQAKLAAKKTKALAQMKQLSLSVMMYAQDADDNFAPASNRTDPTQDPTIWPVILNPYVKDKNIFVAEDSKGRFAESWAGLAGDPLTSRRNQSIGYSDATGVDPLSTAVPGAAPLGTEGFGSSASFSSTEFAADTGLFAVTPNGVGKERGYVFNPYNGANSPDGVYSKGLPLIGDVNLCTTIYKGVNHTGKPAGELKPIYARFGGDGTGNGVTPIIFADGHAKLLSANSLNTFGKVIWRFR